MIAQVKAALPWSWLRVPPNRLITTYVASSAESDSATPRVPRRSPAVNGGTASAPEDGGGRVRRQAGDRADQGRVEDQQQASPGARAARRR